MTGNLLPETSQTTAWDLKPVGGQGERKERPLREYSGKGGMLCDNDDDNDDNVTFTESL